jgi:hypothetical protein
MSLVIETESSQEKTLPALSPVVNKEAHDEEKCVIKHGEDLSGPDTVVDSLEYWNNPRINTWRFLATLLSFLMMGGNDGAFGVWPSANLLIICD